MSLTILCHNCQQPLTPWSGNNWHVKDRYQTQYDCQNKNCYVGFAKSCELTINFPEEEIILYQLYIRHRDKVYNIQNSEHNASTWLSVVFKQSEHLQDIIKVNKKYNLNLKESLKPQVEKLLLRLLSMVPFS